MQNLDLPAARLSTFDGSIDDADLSATEHASDSAVERTPFGGRLLWVGNATCIIEHSGIRFMTDPNFLHAGDHVHLGPGVTAERTKEPAFDYSNCPAVDFILLSHLHEDHFDNLVAEHLRKSVPIVSTPHACEKLKGQGHVSLHPLETWESVQVTKGDQSLVITAMPGKHTLGVFDALNSVLAAIPPVMGSMVRFDQDGREYNLYISGDTLYYDELKEIREKNPKINLALIHLGGTTLPVVRVMVTMDGAQGVKLLCALQPDKAIPIHFDDYNVFESPLEDFKSEVEKEGWSDRVVYLGRGETFGF